jgi:hypothetical protein
VELLPADGDNDADTPDAMVLGVTPCGVATNDSDALGSRRSLRTTSFNHVVVVSTYYVLAQSRPTTCQSPSYILVFKLHDPRPI